MKTLALQILCCLLSGCAGGSFAWEDVHHSTHLERLVGARQQAELSNAQLLREFADGSLSKDDYYRLVKANHDRAETTP